MNTKLYQRPIITLPRWARSVTASRIRRGHRWAISWRRLFAVSVVATSLSGCGDPLMDRGLLDGPRVLGARVQTLEDATVASVAPGQDVMMTFFVVEPTRLPEVSYEFSVCEAEPTVRDIPYCAGEPFAHTVVREPSSAMPQFEFTMPAANELLGNEELLVQGAICFDGEVDRSDTATTLEGYRCAGTTATPKLVTMNVDVAMDGQLNHNPSIAGATVKFDGDSWVEWPGDADPNVACDEAPIELSRVTAGSGKYDIEFLVPASEREPVERQSSKAAAHESYQLSHVVSLGELDRPFSVVDDDTPERKLSIEWTAPSKVSGSGEIVRFFFVARDLRGGVDFKTYALCVEPQ